MADAAEQYGGLARLRPSPIWSCSVHRSASGLALVNDPRPHWDDVYAAKAADELSWYQARPAESLKLIHAATSDRSASIIDVGCGTGILIAELAKEGCRDLTGLDASAIAVENARARLGDTADRVTWIVADITQWSPERTWDVWHDRAVFHFLTLHAAQDAYIAAVSAALRPGGTAVIATFALDGPEKCSGLPVQRYSAASMAERLGPGFRLVSETPERHVTPKGAVQSFVYAIFVRV